MLDELLRKCVETTTMHKIQFTHFSLQDLRPIGVSAKLNRGKSDTQDVSRRRSGKLIAATCDRRKLKKATPAG